MVGKGCVIPFFCLSALCMAGCDSALKGAEVTDEPSETAVELRWNAAQRTAWDVRNGVPVEFDLGDSLFLDGFDVVLPTRVDLYESKKDTASDLTWHKGEKPWALLLCRFLSRYRNDLKAVYAAELARKLRERGDVGDATGRIVLTMKLARSPKPGQFGPAEVRVDSSSTLDVSFAEVVRKEALRWKIQNLHDYVASIPIDFVTRGQLDSVLAHLPKPHPVEECPDGSIYEFSMGTVLYPDGTMMVPGGAWGETTDPVPVYPYHSDYMRGRDDPSGRWREHPCSSEWTFGKRPASAS